MKNSKENTSDYKVTDKVILVHYSDFDGSNDQCHNQIKKSDIKHQKSIKEFQDSAQGSKRKMKSLIYDWVSRHEKEDGTEYMALIWDHKEGQYLEA